jgi:hypothetical protein
MNCLHCGHCCKALNPFGKDVCRYLVAEDTFHFCSVYDRRPKACRNHEYPFKHCPIGINELQLHEPSDIWRRIDDGYERLEVMP